MATFNFRKINLDDNWDADMPRSAETDDFLALTCEEDFIVENTTHDIQNVVLVEEEADCCGELREWLTTGQARMVDTLKPSDD